MKINNYKITSKVLTSIFIISIFLLFFTASISYKQIQTLTDSQKSMMLSYNVNFELQKLLTSVKDGESGQRGYFLTSDTIFLRPYKRAQEKANESLKILRKLTLGDSLQQKKIDEMTL